MNATDLVILENKIHPKVRLNSICPYFTMFPIVFPYSVLSDAKKTDLVYDPFCGRGTTNYAARLLGLSSFGVDSNPVAHAIAQAKLIKIKPQSIVNLCMDILLHTDPKEIPSGEFWELAYHPDTLIDICRIRDYLYSKKNLTKAEIALRAIMLGILHGPKMKSQASYLSNQMPRTFATKPAYSIKYWKNKKLTPDYVGVLELVKRRSRYIFNDQLPDDVHGKIVLGDSRDIQKLAEQKYDWVVTSPPYFGMSTYKQDQWLRNWFLGESDKVDYSNKFQLKHWSEKAFIKDLAKVWINTAEKCHPEAKLVIRFGALPSKSNTTPTEIIKDSLELSNCGWSIEKINTAGKPIDSKRQANQFKNSTGRYIEEIDVFASLKI